MDISLTNIDNKANKALRATSIHGMLWLQTHFENDEWEALSTNSVIISDADAIRLSEDATLAGIKIESLSDISILDVLSKTN